ncbi:MAG: hypothetical protein GEU90_18750 [Gemmatimonas sp.]|nr:hypothetical protein [Gemmatimonas sp.]
MTRRDTRALIAVVGLNLAAVGCGGATTSQRTGVVAPEATAAGGGGAFTSVQSDRGEQAFNDSCAGCHSPNEFTGRLFDITWANKSAADFYEFIRTAMPYDRPGALPEQQYADIVSYILQLNGHPTGTEELPPDAAAMAGLNLGR